MKATRYILTGLAIAGLTACQQDLRTPSSALRNAESYVETVSKSFAGVARGAPTSARGNNGTWTSTQNPSTFQPVSLPISNWTTNYWQSNYNPQIGLVGQYLMYPDMNSEVNRCKAMVDAIPAKLENIEFMLGTLERCLFRLAIHKAGAMNHLWRNEDPRILQYAGFLNDYARPGGFGMFGYQGYMQFLLNGQTGYVSP